ncbi:MAG: iron chelate uptake ABC transporter family permease subunit [Candidatus Latescibacterota bacterium]
MIELLSFRFVQMAVICALILAGIHAYLGFHIVSRGVIFVDLSLAQMAALGAVFAIASGIGEKGPLQYVISLLFTFLGAVLISIMRTRDERIPQEAFIGILYAGGSAFAILLLSHQPQGMEELQHMLTGSLLTVSPGENIKLAVAYTAIGLFHYMFRERFFLITSNRAAARQRGLNVTWWDFLFYASFGIVVTSSVAVAGVLLVFSFLVIPPVIALLFTRQSSHRLSLGWIVAFLGSVGGIFLSVACNLPAGPSIIAVLIAILALTAVIALISRQSGA